MGGIMYTQSGVTQNLIFTGAIPYVKFDIYVYYSTSALVAMGTQTFLILDKDGVAVTSQTGYNIGGATTFTKNL